MPYEYEDPSCVEIGTILFFAPDLDDPDQKASREDPYKYAKQICETCPHRIECAEWGIKYENHGVWGGLTPLDRRNMRRRLRITVKDPLPFKIER